MVGRSRRREVVVAAMVAGALLLMPAALSLELRLIPPGGGPHVKAFMPSGREQSSFMAYHRGFDGGVSIAGADLDEPPSLLSGETPRAEIITGAGMGGGPHVKVFEGSAGLRVSFMAYGRDFQGGVSVAAADLDGDGVSEIVTGPGPTGGPHVRTFSGSGGPRGAGFFAYGRSFPGGVNVAAADLDGDGVSEIVTGAGPTGGPHVRVFSPGGSPWGRGFFAYNTAFSGGVNVAAADLDGDGRAEIITGPGPGGGPHVKVFNGSGTLERAFMAYHPSFRGGVKVAAADFDGDGVSEIVTGPGPGGGPHVRVFSPEGSPWGRGFFAYGKRYRGGVNVAASDVTGDGSAEILTGAGVGRVMILPKVVRTYTYRFATAGVVHADRATFQRHVAETLEHDRGWRAAGISFRRVSSQAQLTIYLSSPSATASAASYCGSFYSCHVSGRVYLNDDRWRKGSPSWPGSLRNYRHMLVNHEVGHFLSMGHVGCPSRGAPAPVMMQQSISLGGCRINPWPLPWELDLARRRNR